MSSEGLPSRSRSCADAFSNRSCLSFCRSCCIMQAAACLGDGQCLLYEEALERALRALISDIAAAAPTTRKIAQAMKLC